ncbi:MAG: hypothetical protein AB7U85_07875 [Alphaproteobacteria bacterium]
MQQEQKDIPVTRMFPVYGELDKVLSFFKESKSFEENKSQISKSIANAHDVVNAVLIDIMPFIAGIAGAGDVVAEINQAFESINTVIVSPANDLQKKSLIKENVLKIRKLLSLIDN